MSAAGLIKEYPVSTAKNGAGEEMGSECTPRGRHVIAGKIGANCPANSVFVGREASGEIYGPELRKRHPQRDWVLTRILRLRGCEPGRNLDGNVDSYNRYIYLHGSPDDVDINTPGSHGCIRLRNQDIIELFDRVEEGTSVNIIED
jgi:L,D-transpeptidase catalytic domain